MDFTTLANLSVLACAAVYGLLYDDWRRRYRRGRAKLSIDVGGGVRFTGIVVLALLVTFAALNGSSRWLLAIDPPRAVRAVGLAVTIAGTALFVWSRFSLGRNYSPCFDAHRPFEVCGRGPYRSVRHPIYASNLLALAGLSIVAGSLWVAAAWLVVARQYRRAALLEESTLAREVEGYGRYMTRTGRFLPRLN
jgi:protein-S-isoprenylcysteine O-methyltransferase Ste14